MKSEKIISLFNKIIQFSCIEHKNIRSKFILSNIFDFTVKRILTEFFKPLYTQYNGVHMFGKIIASQIISLDEPFLA